MIRLVATVTVAPELVDEAIERARGMLTADPAVLEAEVGPCIDVKSGDSVRGSYVVSASFASHDELLRYVDGPAHTEVLQWVLPHRLDEHVAVYEVERLR